MSLIAIQYVGFLRGINVGGNHMVKMVDLKKTLEKLGFLNVKTLLASGNIYFESTTLDMQALKNLIEKELRKAFGFEIPVMLRTMETLQDLVKADPFKKIKVTPETRLYVTFLNDKPKSGEKTAYKSPLKDFHILQVTDGEVFSVLVLSPKIRSVDSMNILEKKFSKNVTTRNWNTVKKMALL